jgi:uncharacterized RDD family membrane protein YckC
LTIDMQTLQSLTNPYAPPTAVVHDIVEPDAQIVPADRSTRLQAAILDSMIFVAMVYLPLFLSALVALGTAGARNNGTRAMFVFALGGLATLVGFTSWCWLTIGYMRRNGQSIAKKFLGIKVVRTDGSPVSLGRLFWLRNVLNGVIGIIPVLVIPTMPLIRGLYALIDSLFIFGESQQCLHDKIADTIVVKA